VYDFVALDLASAKVSVAKVSVEVLTRDVRRFRKRLFCDHERVLASGAGQTYLQWD